tara:strand:- start:319 stop:723 length:405 start_codon:yes stop_codon:yes gene_type:complete
MGRIITREIRDKLYPLIESDDETNWSLALELLRGLEGLSNDGAEEWFYLTFRDYWKGMLFSARNRAFTFLSENMSKSHRKKIKLSNYFEYMLDNKLFFNSKYGLLDGTTTRIKLSQTKGAVKLLNGNYQWKLSK